MQSSHRGYNNASGFVFNYMNGLMQYEEKYPTEVISVPTYVNEENTAGFKLTSHGKKVEPVKRSLLGEKQMNQPHVNVLQETLENWYEETTLDPTVFFDAPEVEKVQKKTGGLTLSDKVMKAFNKKKSKGKKGKDDDEY
jgi:hypothetical protein